MININKKGMTLNEIMLAMLILAVAFIPTIGVLSSAMRATEKDDHIIKGMALCQEKLNIALQFPFGELTNKTYKNVEVKSKNTENQIILDLRDVTNYGVNYKYELTVASESVKLVVPMFDFVRLLNCKKNHPTEWKTHETLCKWKLSNSTNIINHMVKRYTSTVRWTEKIGGKDKEFFYTLSALKANIR